MKTRNIIHWLWLGLVICLLNAAPAHAFYNPQQGRWLSRDPLEENGGVNVLAFDRNDLIDFIDYLGQKKMGRDDGAQAIRSGLDSLKNACDKGCGFFHCCNKKDCKDAAAKLIEALATAWERNWGNGPYDDNAPGGSDTVGGYFCWDWASIFQNAAASLNMKCFSADIGMAQAPAQPGGIPQHFYLEVSAC